MKEEFDLVLRQSFGTSTYVSSDCDCFSPDRRKTRTQMPELNLKHSLESGVHSISSEWSSLSEAFTLPDGFISVSDIVMTTMTFQSLCGFI